MRSSYGEKGQEEKIGAQFEEEAQSRFGGSAISVATLESIAQRPTEYGLSQNYPNPFNPETTIQYQLPEDGRVSLVIYNMMGQKVRTLLSGEKEAGYHQVVWDGCDDRGMKVSSGIYVYHIGVADFHKSRKFILVE